MTGRPNFFVEDTFLVSVLDTCRLFYLLKSQINLVFTCLYCRCCEIIKYRIILITNLICWMKCIHKQSKSQACWDLVFLFLYRVPKLLPASSGFSFAVLAFSSSLPPALSLLRDVSCSWAFFISLQRLASAFFCPTAEVLQSLPLLGEFLVIPSLSRSSTTFVLSWAESPA